jgi:hypothetical protein
MSIASFNRFDAAVIFPKIEIRKAKNNRQAGKIFARVQRRLDPLSLFGTPDL